MTYLVCSSGHITTELKNRKVHLKPINFTVFKLFFKNPSMKEAEAKGNPEVQVPVSTRAGCPFNKFSNRTQEAGARCVAEQL